MPSPQRRPLTDEQLDAAVWSSPPALLSLLEQARDSNEFEFAARLQRRLLDLGVAVLFRERGEGEEGRDGR